MTFIVTNKGSLKHDFWIAGKKTPLLAHGKSATITVTIKKGKNAYKCTVPGHAAARHEGHLHRYVGIAWQARGRLRARLSPRSAGSARRSRASGRSASSAR